MQAAVENLAQTLVQKCAKSTTTEFSSDYAVILQCIYRKSGRGRKLLQETLTQLFEKNSRVVDQEPYVFFARQNTDFHQAKFARAATSSALRPSFDELLAQLSWLHHKTDVSDAASLDNILLSTQHLLLETWSVFRTHLKQAVQATTSNLMLKIAEASRNGMLVNYNSSRAVLFEKQHMLFVKLMFWNKVLFAEKVDTLSQDDCDFLTARFKDTFSIARQMVRFVDCRASFALKHIIFETAVVGLACAQALDLAQYKVAVANGFAVHEGNQIPVECIPDPEDSTKNCPSALTSCAKWMLILSCVEHLLPRPRRGVAAVPTYNEEKLAAQQSGPNQAYSWERFGKVYVAQSLLGKKAGYGVFAACDFQTDDVVTEYCGTFYTSEASIPIDKRSHVRRVGYEEEHKKRRSSPRRKAVIDGTRLTHPNLLTSKQVGQIMNDPLDKEFVNCRNVGFSQVEIPDGVAVFVDGKPAKDGILRLFEVAIRPIAQGEELYTDYRYNAEDIKQYELIRKTNTRSRAPRPIDGLLREED